MREDAATPYILIVDEINRVNPPKVFGELCFLPGYRDQAMSLQYSPTEEFILPENLFIIGTMNIYAILMLRDLQGETGPAARSRRSEVRAASALSGTVTAAGAVARRMATSSSGQ